MTIFWKQARGASHRRRWNEIGHTMAVAVLLVASFTATAAACADGIESDSQPGIRVTFLGTGTPAPNPRQFGQSILVEVGSTKLLFDCGRGCAHRLWNLGHQKLRDTSHLFLTHMHSDHTVGVADLYLNGWNLGRTKNLLIYGPAGADTLMKHIRLAYEEDVVIRADLQVHNVTREALNHQAIEVSDSEQYKIGDATVTAILVNHHVVEPAYGYRIDAGGHSVVISGDTTFSENLIKHSTDVDLLIHEVMSPALEEFVRTTFPPDVADDIVALHTLAPDVGRVFAEARPRLGVMTHLDNAPRHIPELMRQTRTTWDSDLVVAKDLMVINVGDVIRVIEPDEDKKH